MASIDQPQMASVLERLAARLEGASIKRSAVEDVIRDHGGAGELRRRVDDALAAARIHVAEDAAAQPEEPEPVPMVEPVDAR